MPISVPSHAGVYYVGPILDNERATFDPAVIAMPEIHGVMIRVPWRRMEPARGRYNWSVIDGIVSQCVAKGKKIGFMILFGNEMPDWAKGVIANTTFTLDRGDGRTRTVTTPHPWDTAYQEAAGRVHEALLGWLRSNGGFDLLAYVRLATVAVDGGELSFPRPRNFGGDASDPIVQTLLGIGYRPSKVVEGYMTMARAIGSMIPPHIPIAQGILNTGSFPAINDDGSVGQSSSTKADIFRAMLADPVLSGRVGVGDQSLTRLSARPLERSQTEIAEMGARRFFQTNKQGGNGAAADTRGTPCDAVSYLETIETGLTYGDVVEVFGSDANRFAPQLAKAWRKKVDGAMPPPSPVPAPPEPAPSPPSPAPIPSPSPPPDLPAPGPLPREPKSPKRERDDKDVRDDRKRERRGRRRKKLSG